MGLAVAALLMIAGLLFLVGMLVWRSRTINKIAGKEADRAAQLDEANARKNAPWSLLIRHEVDRPSGDEQVVFYAHRVFYTPNYPSGWEQGERIELARVSHGDEKSLVDVKAEFDAARFTAQQLVSDLEEMRAQEG
jgi:hypothetical protein